MDKKRELWECCLFLFIFDVSKIYVNIKVAEEQRERKKKERIWKEETQ